MIANLCLSNKTVTYSRVLYDALHTRNTSRVADSLLLCRDNRYSRSARSPRPPSLFEAKSQLASPYVDNGSWWLVG